MDPPKWKYQSVYDIDTYQLAWFFNRPMDDNLVLRKSQNLDDLKKEYWHFINNADFVGMKDEAEFHKERNEKEAKEGQEAQDEDDLIENGPKIPGLE